MLNQVLKTYINAEEIAAGMLNTKIQVYGAMEINE
jgi:hypothetical protein